MRIGLLTGQEDTFRRALIERIGAIGGAGIVAEPVSLEAWSMGAASSYSCILDRASYEVAFYRGVMRAIAMAGVPVINDPFKLDVLDRFTALERCRRAGLDVPRTLLLPQKEYPPNVAPGALRNLAYPQPWDTYIGGVGGNAWLKPVSARSFLAELPVASEQDLLSAFDRTGSELVMLQESIPWESYVRCIVIGGEQVILSGYDPAYRQDLGDPDHLTAATKKRIVATACKVSSLLGLDLNAVGFAIDDGQARLADPFNPHPDLEAASLTPPHFETATREIAKLCLTRARGGGAPRHRSRRDRVKVAFRSSRASVQRKLPRKMNPVLKPSTRPALRCDPAALKDWRVAAGDDPQQS